MKYHRAVFKEATGKEMLGPMTSGGVDRNFLRRAGGAMLNGSLQASVCGGGNSIYAAGWRMAMGLYDEMRRLPLIIPLLLGAIVLFPLSLDAARIGDFGEVCIAEQARRFFSLQDPAVRYAIAGSLLLGLTCGLLGSFIVVRRLALMGDTLSHAVLPGVVLGFLWGMTRDPVVIFIGATVAGVLGAFTVTFITRTTHLKADTALGIVLAGYFAVGAVMLTMVQRVPTGAQSGINYYLFGQAATIGPDDLWLMGSVGMAVVALLLLFYKELLATSFDGEFAQLVGIPARIVHHMLMLLLAFSVVISLQAVGVVMVSAMLVIPAAAAYLLVERMSRMIVLAACFGMMSGFLGTFFSYLGHNLPTGPFMVLASGMLFSGAFLLSPRHGIVPRAWRNLSGRRRISRENTLKSIYHVIEARGFSETSIFTTELARHRGESEAEARDRLRALSRRGLAEIDRMGRINLTESGWKRAAAIVRNHRLWELYLTEVAQVPSDHVHDDAEKIEHVIGEETVRALEARLGYATVDPHGSAIPASADIDRGDFTIQRPARSMERKEGIEK